MLNGPCCRYVRFNNPIRFHIQRAFSYLPNRHLILLRKFGTTIKNLNQGSNDTDATLPPTGASTSGGLPREDREIFSLCVPENLTPSSLGVSVHAWKMFPYLALGAMKNPLYLHLPCRPAGPGRSSPPITALFSSLSDRVNLRPAGDEKRRAPPPHPALLSLLMVTRVRCATFVAAAPDVPTSPGAAGAPPCILRTGICMYGEHVV